MQLKVKFHTLLRKFVLEIMIIMYASRIARHQFAAESLRDMHLYLTYLQTSQDRTRQDPRSFKRDPLPALALLHMLAEVLNSLNLNARNPLFDEPSSLICTVYVDGSGLVEKRTVRPIFPSLTKDKDSL